MKKVIYFFGILFLLIIFISNLLFTAYLDASEHITINFNSIKYFLELVLFCIIILYVTKIINKYLYRDKEDKKIIKLRRILFATALIIYIIFMIIWVNAIRPPIIGDQGHVCDLAETFYSGNMKEYLPKMSYAGVTIERYMEAYQQQIPLAFLFSIFFRIINFQVRELIRVINIIFNILIVFALYKIGIILDKKYQINKLRLLVLILTFISLPMLSTFIYGDIPSIALCMYNVYFIMEYTQNKKYKYLIFASICMVFAYMFRMNSLIFIISTVIYLVLDMFREFNVKLFKEKLLNILIIVLYVIISITPASLIKNYYLNKYNLEKNNAYPNISYFLMAMEEGPRGNGWYNEKRGEYALKNSKIAKEEYFNEVERRIKYFSKNIGYTISFYSIKMASMWTENTYSAVNINAIGNYDFLRNMIKPLTFYQKVLIILMCICSLIILLQNRKNISIEVIFLLTIFIGGFVFHLLWEAKSRYIIPYVLVLIPISSIHIRKNKFLSKIQLKK